MLIEGFVAVGGNEIGDLTGITDVRIIGETLERTMPNRTPRAISFFEGYWRRFLLEMQIGDPVVLPTQSDDLAIGMVTGGYEYRSDEDEHARHRRAVRWIATGVPRSDASPDLLRVVSGRHTIQEIKQPDAAAQLCALAKQGVEPR
jgi:restriction system protein